MGGVCVQVTILDFNETKFINFEAEINFPEDEGIVQVGVGQWDYSVFEP